VSKSKGQGSAKRAHQERPSQRRIGKSASSIRKSRALQIVFGEEPIIHVGGPIYDVPSQTRCLRYSVNIERLTCECKFWRDRRVVCKHIEAVRLYQTQHKLLPEPNPGLPNAFKNAPWYDRLKAREFDIFSLLLRSLGTALGEKIDVEEGMVA
jgi:hypothetical protein